LLKLFSDHAPLILDFGFHSFNRKYHFRFERYWIFQDGFSLLVVQWWSHRSLGHNKAKSWQIKIKYIHMKMKGWSRNISHDIKLKKSELIDKITFLESVQDQRDLLSDEIDELLTFKKELYGIHQDEVVKWTQRAKDKWIL
jgi:hypothetical protein